MKRTWTIVGVRDVSASTTWYQSLFGQPERPPAHEDFGQFVDDDGTGGSRVRSGPASRGGTRMRPSTLFALLVGVQAAHSVEEYLLGLYADFPPAAFVAGLLSSDIPHGFLTANVLIVAFGIVCCLGPVRRRWPSARTVMWGWALVEIVNGIGHPLRSVLARQYTAGTATAVGLLVVALLLVRALSVRHTI